MKLPYENKFKEYVADNGDGGVVDFDGKLIIRPASQKI